MDYTPDELLKIIKPADKIVLTTHVVPDGDAIGSELAFCEYLKQLGKNPEIINHSPTPYFLQFLDKENKILVFKDNIEKYKHKILEADLIVLLDTNEFSRTKTMESFVNESKAKKICIDHHLGLIAENYDYVISDINSPATCEMLYHIISKDNPDYINKDTANCLYTGIMTDTGSFRYPRTTAETFSICADLITKGADPVYIYEKINAENPVSKIKLLSLFLSSLEFYNDNKICIGQLTIDDFQKSGSDNTEIEGFTSYIMSLKDVAVGIIIVELNDSLKLSFRSKGEIYVNELAKEFDGGGHKNAAGANVPKQDFNEIKKIILDKTKKYI
ncbi:MAG TPA: bifunctional oligoribonuclease/PAP phosphatase NrnA [Ignavibacteria bacterium]|nr:bifunctional oligoribonuclease/PAP phosphatase NrnA [Ignavibacteria bacterium]